MEARALFRLGKQHRASESLEESERLLVKGGDYGDRSTILSWQGRIARQKGDYELASRKFREAIGLHEHRGDHSAPGLARSRSNFAYTAVLRARDLEDKKRQPAVVKEIEDLWASASRSLDLAEAICTEFTGYQRNRELARVHLYRAELLSDQSQTLEALKQAKTAERLGKLASLQATTVHSLIAQCQLTAQPSVNQALEAIELADTTQHRRLRTRTRIWAARTLLTDNHRNLPAARQLFSEVCSEIRDTDGDYLRIELDTLDVALNATGSPDARLCEVTQAFVEGNGLERALTSLERQIVNQVFEAHDRNISLTSRVLRTSRNRVRRAVNSKGSPASEPVMARVRPLENALDPTPEQQALEKIRKRIRRRGVNPKDVRLHSHTDSRWPFDFGVGR